MSSPVAIEVRRAFELPPEDETSLEARGEMWETVALPEGGGTSLWLFIYDHVLPPGYCNAAAGGLAIGSCLIGLRLTGYPAGALDMAYFHPPLHRVDGRPIPAVSELTLDGKQFQQWSRHYTPANPFRVGVDTLSTHLGVVDEWLAREVRR